MLTNDFEDSSPTASAAEIAGLRATFDNGGAIDVIAACALLSIEDATENDRRRAGQPASVATKPAQPGTLGARPTVTDAGRARVREIRARVNAADAKGALLEEIGRKHGTDAAKAARDFGLADLVTRAAAPTREAISASWDRAFRRCGANIESNGARPSEADKHGWSNVMARHGASL
jgi:hypothetical protein